MKKTLVAFAVLGAFVGSAFAAEVTLYGRIDGGLQYNQNKVEYNGQEVIDDSNFEMASGQSTGSRFGLKGTEEISEGLKVGFVLEHGFNVDDGSFNDEDRLFDREATFQLISDDFGTLALGRTGSIKSDSGTFGFYAGAVNPFGNGWSNIPGVGSSLFAGAESRYDNTITYKSPTFAGTTIYAQYSMGGNDENEMTHRAERYAALGVNYVAGNVNLAAVVDWTDEAFEKDFLNKVGGERDDQYTINIGGSYDCGHAKTYLAASYFKNANDVAGMVDLLDDTTKAAVEMADYPLPEELVNWSAVFDKFKGYSVALGTDIPAFGGNFLVSLGYTDAEEENWKADFKAYSGAVAYTYPLSKRTNLYAAGVYNNREIDGTFFGNAVEQDQYQAFFGMVHKF